jgi:phosphoglycolate phosphatase
VLSIVGLSLPEAMAVLAPDAQPDTRARMVEAYKDGYMTLRAQTGAAQSSPLYPGVRAMLDHLAAQDHILLGVATGKSRRGLDKLIEAHDLKGLFVTEQVSDHHPSKPHPAMLLAALAETGLDPHASAMIGDTSYDMEMAHAAGIAGIGVSWGYHDPSRLRTAAHVLDDISALPAALDKVWSGSP